MTGLSPTMSGQSFDILGGRFCFGSPSALCQFQLATPMAGSFRIAMVPTAKITPPMLKREIQPAKQGGPQFGAQT